MVNFEHKSGVILTSDYFPEKGEKLIKTEEEAWDLAKDFATKTRGKCVNIYVVDKRGVPVAGYKERFIENR
jgi:hypothetical protein